MKKYLSLVLALVLIATAIPFTALNASAAPTEMYMGDANGDGDVTAIDARITLQVAAGTKDVDANTLARLDMDGNGTVTAFDARKVLQTAAGNIEKVPVDNGTLTPDELKSILLRFGYVYDPEQNIFYTDMNPWQRWFGFTDAYDSAAAYASMWYMTLKIDFEYNDLLWRLQWWKGQYGVLEGAELGVYTKKPENKDFPFYKCAEDPNRLTMYFEYYQTAKDYNNGNCLFIRQEQEHWWLTGFKFGVCNPTKNIVKATLIAENDIMADGIEEGLKNVTDKTGRPNGFKEYKQWIPIEMQGYNFYTREKLDNGRTKFTVVWRDAGYLNFGEEHVCEFGEPRVIKQPTCVDEGVQRRTCTICNYEVDEAIPATGIHTMGLPIVTTLPGCATEGVTKIPCIHCDYYETGSVPATGVHTLGEEQVVTAPTCTEPGVGKKVCANCEYYVTTIIPATGHDMAAPIVVTEPTCTEDGVKRANCKHCDYFKTEAIPATGHDMGAAVTTTQPTCVKAGVKTATCKNCEHTVTEAIPATGEHDMNDAVVEKAPTCTEAGTKKATCKNCDHYVVTPVAATGHDMNDATIVTEPTCTEAGVKKATCKNCDYYVETPVAATGHHMGDWTVVTAPTTEADGLKEKVCQNEGCDHKVTEPIAKLPVVEPEEPSVPDTDA